MKRLYSNKWIIFSLILPGLLTFMFAILALICLSFYFSLTDYSGMSTPVFIGLSNYMNLITDKTFWTALLNTILLAVVLL